MYANHITCKSTNSKPHLTEQVSCCIACPDSDSTQLVCNRVCRLFIALHTFGTSHRIPLPLQADQVWCLPQPASATSVPSGWRSSLAQPCLLGWSVDCREFASMPPSSNLTTALGFSAAFPTLCMKLTPFVAQQRSLVTSNRCNTLHVSESGVY